MSRALLWVENTAETVSSGSARLENARVRRHAQQNRRRDLADTVASNVPEGGQQLREHATGVPRPSLRPNRSLGRLATEPAGSAAAPKRKKPTTSRKTFVTANRSAMTEYNVALPQGLSWCWSRYSAKERRCLAFFQLRTAQEWSGWEDSYFWNRLALQASQMNEAVARSLIAVSALHEHAEAIGNVEKMRLKCLSFEQSGKAAELLLTTSTMSYSEALVSCLIMICFHGLQHSQASFVLLRSGLRLLQESHFAKRASAEERMLVDKQLRPLFNRLMSSRCGMGDPCDALALSVERNRANNALTVEEQPVVPHMFSSLSEARHCLQRLLNWAHDNIPTLPCAALALELFFTSFHRLKDQWTVAVAQVQVQGGRDLRSLKLIKAASIVNTIILETVYCSEETTYDNYLTAFGDVISLVERAGLSGYSFGIDAGLLDMVAFIGSRCRDPCIRRRALRLLKSGRFEGDRIGSNPATILEALISLEERGLEVKSCHDVAETSRRRLVRGQQHIGQGRIDLFFTSGDGSVNEKCSVSLAGVTPRKSSEVIDDKANVPDAIFGQGRAAYLEDRQTMKYFRLELDRFYFYIPRA